MDPGERNRDELLAAFVDHTSDALWAVSPDRSELVFANDRCEAVWGRDVETLRSDPRGVLAAVHPDDREDVADGLERVASGDPVELRCRTNPTEGARGRVRLRGEPYRDQDGVVRQLLVIASDETERDAIRADRDRYRTVVDNVRDGIYLYDRDGELVFANRAAVEHSPLCREELLGRSLSELLADMMTDGGTVEEVRSAFESLVAGERSEHRHRLWFESVDGPKPFAIRSARCESDDGEFVGVVSVLREISDRVETERDLQQRNERLTEFAGIVSHDLRNPLNIATGRLEMARRKRDSEDLEAVARAHDRIEGLISDLLRVTRVGRATPDVETVELAPFVRDCWDGVATGDGTLVVESDRTVRADPSQLRQLFENLFRNAVEHGSTSPRSQSREDAGRASASEPSVGDAPENALEHAGGGVTVTVGDLPDGFFVADDGPGIPESERDSVFDTGYTTNADGTGLGLDIVEQVTLAHGWEVAVTESAAESRTGSEAPGTDTSPGARFEFTGIDSD